MKCRDREGEETRVCVKERERECVCERERERERRPKTGLMTARFENVCPAEKKSE